MAFKSREAAREYFREYRRRNPEKFKAVRERGKEKRRAYDRDRYLRLAEEIRERSRLYRLAHGDRINRERREATAARRVTLPPRCDHGAFDTVTEHSAYWAGFLMADGCVHGNEISVGLEASDAPHLASLASFLGVAREPLVSREQTAYGPVDRARFTVKSKRLVAALASFGVLPRKSAAARVLRLQDDPHFWRGVVDGDGSIVIKPRPRDYPVLSCLGSRALMGQFAAFVSKILDGKAVRVRPFKTIYEASVAGSFAVPVVRALYGGCTVALPRKLALAERAMRRTFAGNCGWRPAVAG